MRFLRHKLASRKLVRLLAAFLGVAGAPAHASGPEIAVDRDVLHARVQAVRDFVESKSDIKKEPGIDFQWPNWPNWGNWGNWPNWPNWGNWFNR
jgi:hypothetical protein